MNKKINIYINGKEVQNTIKSLTAEMKKLRAEQAKLPIGSDEYIAHAKRIRQIDGILREQRRAVTEMGDAWQNALRTMSRIGNTIGGLRAFGAMVKATGDSINNIVETAAQLDDAYAKVRKTTGLSKEEVAALNESFKQMDTRTAREQLNNLAYQAGKLGINTREAVEQFVKASDVINVALGDVLGDDAMITIGKLTEVYRKSTEVFEGKNLEERMYAIGDAVNELGKRSTAQEDYIVDFTARLGGLANQAGMSASEVMGFASTLSRNMQRVEMSSTAFQKMLQNMIKKPAEFASVAGMEVQKFSELVATDLNEAVMRVLEGLSGAGGFAKIVPMFKDMGLDGTRAAQAISTLANNIDQVIEGQAIAQQQMEAGGSMMQEYIKMNSSMEAEMEKVQKRMVDAREELGKNLYPVGVKILGLVADGTTAISDIITALKEDAGVRGALLAGILAYTAGLVKMRGQEVMLLAQQKLKSFANLKEQKETLRLIVAKNRERAERARNLVALIAERKAELEAAIAVDIANGATEKSVAVRRKRAAIVTLDTRAENLNTVATEANTVAQEAQKRVMASTPWGLIALAVAGVVYGITRLGAETRKTNKEVADINRRIGEETAEAKMLFNALGNAEKGSREYKTTLAKLNAMYPDIIAKYRDEAGALTDIAAARQEIIDKIGQQVAAESRLEKYRSISGEFESGTKGRARQIYDYFGGDAERYSAVMGALPKGYERRIGPAEVAEIYANIKRTAGVDVGTLFQWNSLKRAVDGYINAVNEAYDAQKKWEGIYKGFGLTGQPGAAGGDSGIVLGDGDGGGGQQPRTAVDPKEAERAAKAQAQVLESMDKLATQLEEKALSGVEQKIVEITDKVEGMKEQLAEAFGENLTAKARGALTDLEAAAFRAKDAAVRKYIADAAKTLTRESGKNDSAESSGLLREIENAADRLSSKLELMDARLAAWKESAAYMEREGMTEEAAEVRALIKEYEELRQKKVDSAFAGVNTAWEGTTLGKKQGANVGSEAQGIVAGSGWLARFAGQSYGKDVQQVLNTYAEARREVTEKLTAQEAKLAEARKAGVSAEVLAGMEAELEVLRQQAGGLEELKRKALELAESDALKRGLRNIADVMEQLGDKMMKIWGSIDTILDNVGKKELKTAQDRKEAEEKLLEEQLQQGLLSQEEYDSKKSALQEEYDKKEKELGLAQWRREQAMSYAEAVISAAVAFLKALSDPTPMPTWLRTANATAVAATAAMQVAAIASEPAPYAEGGYVPRRSYFMAGEAGEEWVASNRLVSDPRTAPVIQALESYQRGGGLDLPYAEMDVAGMGAAADALAASRADQREMLAVMKDLAGYLKDPANRRAVISRRTEVLFEGNEAFLRAAARL